ncbi:MAG: tetratricopeptide repeat protein [Saprospiraceae bacterium]|nr:tetratricopeptide repeat protein [Saprospiraceae bacterium]
MKRFLILLALWGGVTGALFAQDARLAQQYFQDGEYEKAAVLFEKLFRVNEQNDYFFNSYIECLIELSSYEKAEQELVKQIRKDPANGSLYVTYGKLLERQDRQEEADKQYLYAIERLTPDQYSIIRLANMFANSMKYDQAIASYEKGAMLLKDNQLFAYNLGDLYRRKGDIPRMVEQYLNSLDDSPERLNNLKTIFQRYLMPEDFKELQAQLYTRLQTDENAVQYVELLTWVFIQRKDYKNAFRQARALDRRLDENGGRVFRLAEIAYNEQDYDAAIEAFEYVVKEKGINSSFYIDAKRGALRSRRNKLVAGYSYTIEDLRKLEMQYDSFLNEFGRSKLTASIVLEMAELEALYINDIDKAVLMLTQMIEYPGIDRVIQARGKLSLGDYYLIKDDPWEATLLYSQVDKAFQEDILGHEARFRNAKLSYYSGDFQWAQAQFEVLKASTSKLIANDALDLSIFIMDNLGLDSTATALEKYAQADLLVFQNRFDDAFTLLDSLLLAFPSHALEDDVWYLKSRIFTKRRDFQQSAQMLQRIIDTYPTDIRADNAIFELAELNEYQLGDIEKAKTLYEKLFIDYSGSTFAVEARKRFRKLRGDNLQ